VGPELVALANRAGAAVVRALTTDAWENARDAVVRLWHRADPRLAEAVETELPEVRAHARAARAIDDGQAEQELVRRWQDLFFGLLATHPELARELRRLLDDELDPMLSDSQPPWADPDLRPAPRDPGIVIEGGDFGVLAGDGAHAAPPPGPIVDEDEW